MRLKEKVAIVTGAASGFGEGIAKRYALEGAYVIVNDVNIEAGKRVAQEIQKSGAPAEFVWGDISRDADVANLVKTTMDHYGGIDIVVNNAGTTHRNRPLLEVEEAEFDRIYAVNVKSLFLTAKHVVPIYRKHGGGVFITIASTAGVRPRPGLT
jgi:3-oxoacyl-[acyl-carrier protein] reductase